MNGVKGFTLSGAAAAMFLLAVAGSAQADVTVVPNKSFSCGTCVVNFSTQPNATTILGSNNDGINVTYTSTNNIAQQGGGQATIEGAKNGTFFNLTIDADQNYAAETFALVGKGATIQIYADTTTTAGLVLLTDANGKSTFTLGSGENKFELLTSLGQLIEQIKIVVTGATGLSTFKQDRLAGQLSQVPLPPALFLFGSGLVGMLALGRRRMRRNQTA
jgi:hypothetical protein